MMDAIVGPLRAIHDWWVLRRVALKKDRHLIGLRLGEPLLKSVFGMVPLGPEGRRWCMHLLVTGRDDDQTRAIFGKERKLLS